MMFMIERFMASAMSLVRMPPEAPTRAPAMIRTGLSSTKPDIAAAVPVNEFSSEMTTGMSAPPMGSTMVTPKVHAATQDHDTTMAVLRPSPMPSRTVPAPAPEDQQQSADDGHDRERERGHLATRDRDRLAGDEALELARGDDRPGEGHAADEHAQDDEDGGRDRLLRVPTTRR